MHQSCPFKPGCQCLLSKLGKGEHTLKRECNLSVPWRRFLQCQLAPTSSGMTLYTYFSRACSMNNWLAVRPDIRQYSVCGEALRLLPEAIGHLIGTVLTVCPPPQ